MAEKSDMKQIGHFIWDFDGTLFDTYPVIIGNLRSALKEFGFDCDYTEAMKLMLISIPNARNHYADKFGIDRKALADAYNRHHSASQSSLPALPFEGTKKVLAKIKASGRFSYIYTHRKYGECMDYLKKYGLETFFEEVIGSDSPSFSGKPNPDSVLYLMRKYGMAETDAVIIGDRECDLGSGRNAGMGTVHILCPVAHEDLVCDYRLTDIREMLELL